MRLHLCEWKARVDNPILAKKNPNFKNCWKQTILTVIRITLHNEVQFANINEFDIMNNFDMNNFHSI